MLICLVIPRDLVRNSEHPMMIILTHSLDILKESMPSQGYDLCDVLTSIQDEGFKERRPLCEVKQQQ